MSNPSSRIMLADANECIFTTSKWPNFTSSDTTVMFRHSNGTANVATAAGSIHTIKPTGFSVITDFR